MFRRSELRWQVPSTVRSFDGRTGSGPPYGESARRMRALVTGGAGFIGSALTRALVRRGDIVRTLDDGSRGSLRRLADVAADIEIVAADIRDAEAVSRATRGVDRVFHLAYINGTEHFYRRPEAVLEVAVKGMVNVLDACRRHEVRELVLASSSEVYQTPSRIPTDERVPLVVPDPLNPRYSYGGGKIISELLAINYGRTGFERVVIFRPHNAYGPDMGWEHVIPQLTVRVRALARSAPGSIALPVQGTGKETRAFVYIDDLVAGILAVADRGEHLGIYNVGTDEEVAIEDLARRIAAWYGRDVQVIPSTGPAGSTPRRRPDISKALKLGYAPHVSLADGLPPTVRWYDAHADERPT